MYTRWCCIVAVVYSRAVGDEMRRYVAASSGSYWCVAGFIQNSGSFTTDGSAPCQAHNNATRCLVTCPHLHTSMTMGRRVGGFRSRTSFRSSTFWCLNVPVIGTLRQRRTAHHTSQTSTWAHHICTRHPTHQHKTPVFGTSRHVQRGRLRLTTFPRDHRTYPSNDHITQTPAPGQPYSGSMRRNTGTA